MTVQTAPVTADTFKGQVDPDWCPGCGDFGVLKSLMGACAELKIAPHDLMVVSGIGCSSNLPGFIHSYGVHSLHGRSVAVASGIKLANQDLNVVITGGDGDGFGIGVGHFIHAMRRNLDVTYIVMDNQVYGLTTGQVSPTSEKGMVTKTSPKGNAEWPVNPIAMALISGATYVARGFSGEPKQLTEILRRGIAHKGFSFIDVFSPCVTYNKQNTYPWFKSNIYNLEEKGHDASKLDAALARSLEWGEKKIPIGVFYETTARRTYQEEDPVFAVGSLVKQPLGVTPELGRKLIAETM
ncbi:MAG: 2-oxoacid ferredoxin oxidoreductase [Planctomycetes bacterium]|nr:2-oxoacid ferredoxin oxidoreductase [Planctomycetota bacterium]